MNKNYYPIIAEVEKSSSSIIILAEKVCVLSLFATVPTPNEYWPVPKYASCFIRYNRCWNIYFGSLEYFIDQYCISFWAGDILDAGKYDSCVYNSSLTVFQFKQERYWMLEMCTDGLRETADYRVMEKRFIFKLLLSYHDSALSDHATQVW